MRGSTVITTSVFVIDTAFLDRNCIIEEKKVRISFNNDHDNNNNHNNNCNNKEVETSGGSLYLS